MVALLFFLTGKIHPCPLQTKIARDISERVRAAEERARLLATAAAARPKADSARPPPLRDHQLRGERCSRQAGARHLPAGVRRHWGPTDGRPCPRGLAERVRAAKAAGLTCVAVPNPISRTLDYSHSDATLTSLEELDLTLPIARYQPTAPS